MKKEMKQMKKEIKTLAVIANSGIKKGRFEFRICYSLKEARQTKREWERFDLEDVKVVKAIITLYL